MEPDGGGAHARHAQMSEPAGIPRAIAVLEQGIADGLHAGAQVYVSRHGRVIADLGLGTSRPGTPLESRTLMLWFSATKPLVAVAVVWHVSAVLQRGGVLLARSMFAWRLRSDDRPQHWPSQWRRWLQRRQ